MATEYDPQVIMKFADRLYAEARSALLTYSFLGALVGAGGGYAMGSYSDKTTYAAVAAVILGAIGFAIGRSRADALRLQAQTALCQVRIEANTRSQAPNRAA